MLLHETGHSLGLDHAKNPAEVMNAVYGGYSSRPLARRHRGHPGDLWRTCSDAYQQHGLGYGFGSAIDVSAGLLTATQTGVTGVELAAIGSAEYFSFVAPAYASGDIQVTAAAGNISMLSPAVILYDAAGNPLAQAANPSAWSDNVTATAHGVVPGRRYYVKVTGATHDVFSVGAYAISVSLPSSTAPRLPPSPPPTVTPRAADSGQRDHPRSVRAQRFGCVRDPSGTSQAGHARRHQPLERDGSRLLPVPDHPGGKLPDQCAGGRDPGVQLARQGPGRGRECLGPALSPGWDRVSPEDLDADRLGRARVQHHDQFTRDPGGSP